VAIAAGKLTINNLGHADAIPNQFIVVFKKGLSASDRAKHIEVMQASGAEADIIPFDISNGKFAGYSVRPTESTLSQILANPEVQYVDQDLVVRTSQACTVQSTVPSWGLDRVGEKELNLDGNFHYGTQAGEGVDAYVIDTGVYIAHNDFQGRAIWGATFTGDNNNADCNGHGTHVAGTIAGTLHGIAKKANVIAVKVLNCGGSGSWTGVIQGIQWTVTRYETTKRPSNANMSLGGGYTQSVNDATAAAVAAGVIMVVAGGNSNTDACTFSPASTVDAITVGSTTVVDNGQTEEDARSTFSNYGPCTDVFAPGSLITSAWIGGVNAVNTISGTSMAAPHVAGVVSAIQGLNPTLAPKPIENILKAQSVNGVIDLICGNNAICNQSPNLLTNNNCA